MVGVGELGLSVVVVVVGNGVGILQVEVGWTGQLVANCTVVLVTVALHDV